MSLFQKSVTNKYLKNLDNDKVDKAYENFQKFYGDKLRLANIMQLKEENYQEGFLREIFVETLGYIINPNKDFNLTTEFKNLNDARKADGAILKDGKAIGVIELKSTKTKNLESIKEQAFGYKNNQPDCKYVITSNFQSLRFYVDNATEYEEFNLFQLNKEKFKLLFLLLSKESIFSDLPEKLKQETKFHENDISDRLYSDYKHFKDKIFENLLKNNPQYDKLTLFKKSQKLLDRFLFVFFAEDSGLIPPNAVSKIVEQWKDLQELDEYKPLYSRFQKLFTHLDKGHVYKKWGEIPAYNGGLFRNDEILDTDKIKIDDEILEKDSLKLSAYDFNTEVDVNILGHIFEHSLNEIEEITAELHGEKLDKKKSKRKKDGVFYTPKYITKYIVENTVGTLCNEKKAELQINNLLIDETYRKKDGKINEKGKKLFKILHSYKDWLITLKILDPACGSGAFLNQTLDFLIAEHKQADDLIAELTGENLRLFDTDKSILENNIFGVDINEESVEIAKLSLWLRTAQKGRKLSDLSGNIKCGNSLIDDPEVAGDKAFDWNVEFKEIMDNGGFDVVIGNPPYGAKLNNKKYYSNKYGFKSNSDTYQLFTILTQNLLTKSGLCGFIIPNSWMTRKAGTEFRQKLHCFDFYYVLDFVNQVFTDANIDTCIIIYSLKSKKNIEKNVLAAKVIQPETIISKINYKNIQISDWFKYDKFNCEFDLITINMFEKLYYNSLKLGKITHITGGYKPYQVGYGKSIEGDFPQTKDDVKNWVYHSKIKKDNTYYPDIKGSNIQHYYIKPNTQWIKWGTWLMSPKKFKDFINPKIVVREVAGFKLNSCYDDYGYFTNDTTHMIRGVEPNFLKFILTIINSNLIGWFFRKYFGEVNVLFPKIKVNELKVLPIKEIPQEEQQPFIEKANLMLSLNKELQTKAEKFIKRIKSNLEITKITNKLNNFYNFDFKTFISELKKQKIALNFKQQDEWEDYFDSYKTEINDLQNQINQTDNEIDKMVYELYQLTEEEIEIVEKSVK